MKKFVAILCLAFASILVMPAFVACNGTGSTTTAGVRFTQSTFEVEYNVPTKLSYQIYPTTATNNNVSIFFSIEPGYYFDYLTNTHEFILKSRSLVDSITATISVNNTFTDTCTIKQKIYPNKISFNTSTFDNKSDVINKNSAFPLHLWGRFDDGDKEIGLDKFDIEYVSSDPSVVFVEGGNAISTGKNGVATITAKIRNSSGEYVVEDPDSMIPRELVAHLELTVVDNVNEAIVALEKVSGFINVSKNSYDRTDNNSYVMPSSTSSVRCAVALYSADGHHLDDDNIKITMVSADASVATVVEQDDNMFLITLQPIGGELTKPVYARIEISTTATDSAGDPVKFVFYIAKAIS